MIHVAEIGLFTPEKTVFLIGQRINFPIPEFFGKRLIKAVEHTDKIAQRVPFDRVMIINENDPAIFVGAGKGIVDNLYFAQNRQFMQQHVDQHDVIFFGQRFAAVMTQETHVGIKIFVFFFGAGQLGFADVNQIVFSIVADAVGCLFNLVAKGRADLKHLLALFDFLQRGVNQPAAVSERKNFK